MFRPVLLICFIALSGPASAVTRQLLPGNAERGREVFHDQGCAACHSLNGAGGSGAPDLARMVVRGFTPDRLATELWNHAPAMWKMFAQKGLQRTGLTPQQAADLFIYFYSLRSFERPGDARRGRKVFQAQGCAACHDLGDSPVPGAPPVRAWQSLDHPLRFAQRMWGHPLAGPPSSSGPGYTPAPTTSQELTDMLAYLRPAAGKNAGGKGGIDAAPFLPASPEQGAQLFASHGCAACHQGSRALEGRPTRFTINELATLLYSHPRLSRPQPLAMNYEDMRSLAGYLLSAQFLNERGDPLRGESLFAKKRCVLCHEAPASGAPARADMAGRMTSFDMAAALWNSGPAMSDALRRKNVPWPHFEGDEMADLAAYVHGYEFKRRPKATSASSAPSNR